MASQFSKDGKYFAKFTNDGKIKIWETNENTPKQEFTPDFHLTSPCTCLQFVDRNSVINKNGSPKKKIRRQSIDASTPFILFGTSTGLLFVYSIAKGEVIYNINSNTSQAISCISWNEGDVVYTAIDQFILCWNLEKRTIKSKWKAGNETITSILILPDNSKLLTASRNIKLWHVETKEVLKTFTGHSSQVSILQYIKPSNSVDSYIVSGAKGDRLLSCWNLNEEHTNNNAVANFVMEDVVTSITHKITSEGSISMAAITRGGVVHIYKHTLNGKCGKPVKPKTTLQVASDTTEDKTIVTLLPILNAVFNQDLSLTICHGFSPFITFENVVISEYEKVQCLIRKDMRKTSTTKENAVSNIKTPIIDKHVQYLTPHTTAKSNAKRKTDGVMEVPMEQRLENLTLSKLDTGSTVPKSNNLAQLLVQGLHSKDKEILKTVLHVKEEQIIKNTVSRLPINVVIPLVKELNNYIQGKTIMCNLGTLWLKYVMNIHAGILLSNPELSDIIGPALSTIENRLTLFSPLNSLKGRLELLVTQLNVDNTNKEIEDEPFLVFNDKDSSDSEMEGMEITAHSESENEWEEMSN